jgi:hypothetical protein
MISNAAITFRRRLKFHVPLNVPKRGYGSCTSGHQSKAISFSSGKCRLGVPSLSLLSYENGNHVIIPLYILRIYFAGEDNLTGNIIAVRVHCQQHLHPTLSPAVKSHQPHQESSWHQQLTNYRTYPIPMMYAQGKIYYGSDTDHEVIGFGACHLSSNHGTSSQ